MKQLHCDVDILVVDDTPANLKLLTDLLRQQGYNIRAALNGSLALGSVEQSRPDLILLDIKMPGMDGFEVCAELKNRPESREIPVIFISALDDPHDKVRAFEAGGVDYITKPIEATEVLARVHTHLMLGQTARELEWQVQERTAQLSASERRLRKAQQMAHIGNWELDLKTNTLHWSDEIYRIFGIDPEKFNASYEAFLAVIHPDDRSRVDATYATAAANNLPYELTHRIIRKDDGQVRYVHEHSEQFCDESGTVVRSQGTVQDVTALEQANRTQKTLSEVNQALVYAEDEQAILDKVCQILINVGGYRMAWVGYPEQDEQKQVRPVAWAGFEAEYIETLVVTWADNEHGRGPTGTALRTRQPLVVCDTRQDSRFAPWREDALARGYHSVLGLPLLVGDELLGVLTVYSGEEDAFCQEELVLITELAGDLAFGIHTQRLRRTLHEHQEHLEELVDDRTEALRTANERLHELDQLKSMFIASMSHELRTPLNSIISFSGILLQGLVGDLNEKQRDSLQRVQRAGYHLLALITDVIDISKIEAGRIEAFIEQVSVADEVDEALDNVRLQAEGKGLELIVAAASWPVVQTDQRRLLQCLVNLLSNAVKYTEAGVISLSVIEASEEVEFVVQDTGIGIAENDMPRLFEAFERFESHLRVQAGGTGLGLYLTKKIATELLQGRIEVESQAGEGSVFRLFIPKKLLPIESVHGEKH